MTNTVTTPVESTLIDVGADTIEVSVREFDSFKVVETTRKPFGIEFAAYDEPSRSGSTHNTMHVHRVESIEVSSGVHNSMSIFIRTSDGSSVRITTFGATGPVPLSIK